MSEVIDHVGIRVSDLATSRRMYEAALAELGFVVLGNGVGRGQTPHRMRHEVLADLCPPGPHALVGR